MLHTLFIQCIHLDLADATERGGSLTWLPLIPCLAPRGSGEGQVYYVLGGGGFFKGASKPPEATHLN